MTILYSCPHLLCTTLKICSKFAVDSTISMYVWLMAINSGLPLPCRVMAAFTTFRANVGVLRGPITERKTGGAEDDTANVGDGRGRLVRGMVEAAVGPSTTKVAYEVTSNALRLKLPSSSGKRAAPSISSLSQTSDGFTYTE